MDKEMHGFLVRLPGWIALGRAVAALLFLGAGLDLAAYHLGLSALSALVLFLAAPRIRTSLLITTLGADWTVIVQDLFELFGWQAGFHWQVLILTYLVFLFEHLRIRTRIILGLLPVAGILVVMFIQADAPPEYILPPDGLLALHLFNLVFFVAATCGILALFSRRLLQQKHRAESEAEARTRLIADLGHELKNPLAALLTQTQVALERDREPERDMETLRTLERNVRALGQLSQRMLDLTRLDLGAFRPDWQEVPLGDLLQECMDLFQPEAARRHVHLVLDLPEGLRVRTDPEGFGMVVRNLVSNAIRHSQEAGTVWITAARQPEDDRLVIRVRDQGPGIAPEHLPRIFDAFFRADPARARRDQAHGLGLSIARRMIEQLGGWIEVSSSLGQGTEFSVHL